MWWANRLADCWIKHDSRSLVAIVKKSEPRYIVVW